MIMSNEETIAANNKEAMVVVEVVMSMAQASREAEMIMAEVVNKEAGTIMAQTSKAEAMEEVDRTMIRMVEVVNRVVEMTMEEADRTMIRMAEAEADRTREAMEATMTTTPMEVDDKSRRDMATNPITVVRKARTQKASNAMVKDKVASLMMTSRARHSMPTNTLATVVIRTSSPQC